MVVALGSRPSPTWLPEDCQVGPPAGELCVGEHHDTVLGGFVETKRSLLGRLDTLTDGVHPCDHFILAQVLAGLVVGRQALNTVSLEKSRAFLTRLPKSSWLCALALPTDTVPTVAADLAILGQARADVC
uniref:Uncharacterized protein n=1 Tax=Panthera tigris altaica TaxID=74533 RepID=A0A8C9KNE2_PANTA